MKKKSGSNVVEYALILVVVGLVIGSALNILSPTLFKDLFKGSFQTTGNSIDANGIESITIGPTTD